MRFRLLPLLALTLACGDGGGPAPDPRAALDGTWALESVNGAPLPFQESADTRLTAGHLTFVSGATLSGGTFTWLRSLTTTPRTDTDTEQFGYGVDGAQVVFHFRCGGCARELVPDTGSVAGPLLTVRRHFHAGTYQFRRQ